MYIHTHTRAYTSYNIRMQLVTTYVNYILQANIHTYIHTYNVHFLCHIVVQIIVGLTTRSNH